MRLDTFALRGIGPFDRGVSVDLRDVAPGLVAIVGPNGAGKSMLMESPLAALYRSFISRERPLTDYAGDHRDAFIETTISVEGRGVYRARVALDGAKGGSEAVLELVAPDGAARFLNDGKVTTFDHVVAQAFPTRAVMLASAFAAQNRAGSFVTISRGERKDLFAELLGLEQYAGYAQTARQAVAALEVARAERRALVDRLEADAGDAVTESIAAEANALQAEIGAIEERLFALDADIIGFEADLAAARENAKRYADALGALATVQADERAQQSALDRANATLDGVVASEQRERLAIDAQRQRRVSAAEDAIARVIAVDALVQRHEREVAAVHTETAADLKDRHERLANNVDIKAQGDAIRAAVKERAALEAQHAAKQAELDAVTDRHTAAVDAVNAAARRIDVAAYSTLARAKEDAALRDCVPCKGQDDCAGCQFLTRATEAAARIPTLQAAVDASVASEQALTEANEVEAAIRHELVAADFAREELADAIGSLAPMANRLATLEAAEDRIKDLERDIADINARRVAGVMKADTAAGERLAERQTRLDELQRELESAAIEHRDALADLAGRAEAYRVEAKQAQDAARTALDAVAPRLTAALQAVETSKSDAEAVEPIEAALIDARRDAGTARADMARLQERASHLHARRVHVLAQRAELEQLCDELTAIDTDAIEWDALARVFGKDGLPVLEIDAAGPTVSAITNDLLQACFGARFTVELVTQEAKKSGKGFKEAFDLKVWDAERPGRDRDVADLSGGEQVLIDEALKSAIAIFVNTRNEYPLRTCWRDETTGALDPENAERYIHMLRRVQQRGGFAHVLFVSHNRQAAAMADVQLHVDDGTVTVLEQPFDRRVA